MLTVRPRTLQVTSVHLNTGLYVRSGGVSTKSGYLGSETQPTSATGDRICFKERNGLTGRLDHLGIHLHCRNFSASPKGTRGFPVASSGGASQLTSTVHLSQTLWSVSLFREHWKAVLFSGWLLSSYSWLEPSDQNQGPTKVRPNTIIIRELHEPCGFFKQYVTTEKLLLFLLPL